MHFRYILTHQCHHGGQKVVHPHVSMSLVGSFFSFWQCLTIIPIVHGSPTFTVTLFCFLRDKHLWYCHLTRLHICVNHLMKPHAWKTGDWVESCRTYGIYWYIQAGTKWPPFRRHHFQMHMFEWKCWLKFHWNMIPRAQLTIFRHWLDNAIQVTRHYLNQWCPRLPMHMSITRPQWVIMEKYIIRNFNMLSGAFSR